MIVSIHNLPARTLYKDIKELLLSKCGISDVLLDKLTREGSGGKSVMVGVVSDADAAVVKKQIDGLYYEGQQLYVKGVGKSNPASNNSSQSGYQQGNQQGYQTNQYQGNQGYSQGNQGYSQGNQGYSQGNQGYSQGNQGYNQGNQCYNQGSQGYNTGNQGYNQGTQVYGQGNQGYNQGNQGYNQGNQGYNQGNQGYNEANPGYSQGNQGYSQGNQGYGQGNQGQNQGNRYSAIAYAYPSMSSVAKMYDQGGDKSFSSSFPNCSQPAQNQFAAFGGQGARAPAPVPSPYAHEGKFNEYSQQYNQQQNPGPSYSEGPSSANRGHSQELVGYPVGPWGASGMANAQSSRNYRDDSGNDRRSFDRDRREKSGLLPSPKTSRWENTSSQAPELPQKNIRESRDWKDQRSQGFQQKGRGKDKSPVNKTRGANQQFQRNQRDDRGSSSQPRYDSEPRGRSAMKEDNPHKRTWEEANKQFQDDECGPSDFYESPNMSGPMKKESSYKQGPKYNRYQSGPRQPPPSARDVKPFAKREKPEWNTEGRRFNKCISQGVATILLDVYKMIRESNEAHVYPTTRPIKHLYKQRITDRVYRLIDGDNTLGKKQVRQIYRETYTVKDDLDLYKEVIRQIRNVETAEDLDKLLIPEEVINNMDCFTKRSRKKAVKKQLYTRDELISQLGITPTIDTQKGYPARVKQVTRFSPRINTHAVTPKIPPHPKNDLKLKKKQKKESKEEIKNMVPYEMPPLWEKCADEDINAMAELLQKQFDNPGTDEMRIKIHKKVDGAAMIDQCKKFFKHHLSKRLTNKGTVLVRIYGYPVKNLKREHLENFLLGKGCTSLQKSKSKNANFFVATLNSYNAADKLVNLGRVSLGPPGFEAIVEFKYMYLAHRPKIPYAKIMESHKNLRNPRKFKTNINLLDKNWPAQELAAKQEAEAKKEAAAKREAERALQEKADAEKNADKDIENGDKSADNTEKEDLGASADTIQETSTADMDIKNDETKTADTNINSEETETTDTDIICVETTTKTNEVITINDDSDVEKKTEQIQPEKEICSNEVQVEKESADDSLPQQSLNTDTNADETGDDWDETGDNWDETGEDWDETTQTVDESQTEDKTIDLDNIDENDLEDY